MSSQATSPMRRSIFSALVFVFVILNIGIWIWRARSTSAPIKAVKDQGRRQQEILSVWNSASVTPIDGFTNFPLKRSTPLIPCFEVPSEGRSINIDELSPEKQADLEAAVVGLVKATVAQSGQALLDYMTSRREVYNPDTARAWRKQLVRKYNYSPDAAVKLSDNEAFLAAWSAMNVSSHWKGFVADESCKTLWATRSIPASQIREPKTLCKGLFDVFREMRTWHHHFVVSDVPDLEDVIKRGDEIFVADVRLLIEHDREFLQQRAPYLVRFWYHPDQHLWHPILLVRVGAFDDAPLDLTF